MSEWQPIETAPALGEFYVRGGVIENELGVQFGRAESKAVKREDEKFVCLMPYDYDIKEWVVSPTEWCPI